MSVGFRVWDPKIKFWLLEFLMLDGLLSVDKMFCFLREPLFFNDILLTWFGGNSRL